MKKYIIIITALLLIAVTGCKKDFLDVKPTEFLSADQLAEASKNNTEVTAGTVTGLYSLMVQEGTGGSGDPVSHYDFGQKNYDIFMDMLCGDVALSVSSYTWYRELTEFSITTDFTQSENYYPWRYYYRLIRSANNVIATLGGNDVIPENEESQYLMGQAKAMRAHSYFYLTQLFTIEYDPADYILPIYTDPNQANQAKSTTTDIFNFIISDLTEAIDLLETFSRSAKNEINKYVAEGILAYVYAYMGENTLAMNLAKDIIDYGGFPIMTADEVTYDPNKTDGNEEDPQPIEDVIGGFNDIYQNPGWMWGIDLTLDIGLDLVSWWGQMDLFTYSYQWAGDHKALDAGLYNLIPADDVRKGQFYYNPGHEYHLLPINKFYDPQRVIGRQREITTDYHWMRIAEMYLLHAETAAKAGFEVDARNSLKALVELRVPDASYIDALTGQDLLDEIYLQTRIELSFEGKTYLAMKRNHKTIIRGANHLSHVGEPINYDDPKLTFCIPQSEIQNNPHIFEGNK